MTKKTDYYGKLKFFFTRRGTDVDHQALKQLDSMSEDEIKTLHDIVFAETEKERFHNIDAFYSKLEEKEKKALHDMTMFKRKMGSILQELEEIGERNVNEDNLDVAMAKI